MDRATLETRLLFNAGGYGLGVGGSLAWAFSAGESPDIPSIVAITGPAEKYTAAELLVLAERSDTLTADYDARWTVRRGANLWVVDKFVLSDGQPAPRPWIVKRLTWQSGYPFHDTLEAMLDWWQAKL